jgi:hypothetical protein
MAVAEAFLISPLIGLGLSLALQACPESMEFERGDPFVEGINEACPGEV